MTALTNQQRDLVAEYRNMAVGIASAHVSRFPASRYLYEDMVQEGCMGLMNCARTFDPSRGVAFGTWAFRHVQQRIKEFARRAMSPASGAPGRQWNTTAATYLSRAPSEHPDGTPIDFPAEERNPILDCAEAEVRKARDQLVGMLATRSRTTNPERDVDLFLLGVMSPGGPNPPGFTLQRVNQLRNRVRPFFQELCDMYQREAA